MAAEDMSLERHAKHLSKGLAKKTASLEKMEATAPAKPFYYPFMPIDKDAVTKYWATVTENTKALYSNPIAWFWFWPYMMWAPWMMWGWYSMAWMWYMPWMWMFWW